MSATKDDLTLIQEVGGLQSNVRGKVPPELLAAMDKVAKDLAESGLGYESLKLCERAPDFSLPNTDGRIVGLQDLLKTGPAVICFFRGVWCPFCNQELQALERHFEKIRSFGASLVAISPQSAEFSATTAEAHALTFDVLIDQGNKVAHEYGLAFRVPEELRPIYRDLGIDLTEYNGDESFELPIPATYVVDRKGIVRGAFVDPDYTKRMDPEEIMSILSDMMIIEREFVQGKRRYHPGQDQSSSPTRIPGT